MKKNLIIALISLSILNCCGTQVFASNKIQQECTFITGWTHENNDWYFYANNIKQIGWLNDNGTWYYLNPNGTMATGWLNDNVTWYYLNPNGAMATGWLNDNGTWYYLNSNGAMATGWLNDNGTWYYLSPNGAMATGWLNDNGTWYYLNSNGAMATNTIIDNWIIDTSGIATPPKNEESGSDNNSGSTDGGNDSTSNDSSEKPQEPQKPTEPQLTYTGSNVLSNLVEMGFRSNGVYIDNVHGYGNIAVLQVKSGDIDMIFSVYANPPELNDTIRNMCNTVLPGYGETLYTAINSGSTETLNLGGRTVVVNAMPYGVRVDIGPIKK